MATVGEDPFVEKQLHARIVRLAPLAINGESLVMRLLLVWCVLAAACGGPQLAEPTVKASVATGLPATLEAPHPKTGDPRPLHVRVWADVGVRALPHWKEELTDQLDYADQILHPMFGVKLTVDKIEDWDHTGSDPRAALAALAKADPGTDAIWVIGYITPGDSASKALDELGAADVLGHYAVVRAWAEKPETDALAATLPDLAPAQRAEVVAAHKRHKQTVLLLHLLGITLGAIDEADPSWIQHPLYSPKMSTWSDRNRELMQMAIDERLGGGTDQTLAHDLLEAIDNHDWGGWIPTSHDQILAFLRNVVDSAKAGKTAADVPAAVFDQFDHVRELAKTHDIKNALVALENLMIAYPGNGAMAELKCELLLDQPGVADKKTREACSRAAELAAGDPTPHFAVGEALAKAHDVAGARTELALAATKIVNLPTGQAEAWHRLVDIYLEMDALTWAEEAIAAGKLDAEHTDPAAAGIVRDRARYGAPKGRFKPEVEGQVVGATRQALVLVGTNKLAEAERTIGAAERKFSGAPGLAAARCDLELVQGAVEPARAACARALAADPDESFALYLSAILSFKDTSAASTKVGIEKLKHAIAVDPELGQAWRALGKAYDRAHDEAARAELAKQYQEKFKQPL
jgi:tetratricopeptide (TPR) repeat protein